jgi:hypothetical protein
MSEQSASDSKGDKKNLINTTENNFNKENPSKDIFEMQK